MVLTTPSLLEIEPAASWETQVVTDATEKIEAIRATGAEKVSRRKYAMKDPGPRDEAKASSEKMAQRTTRRAMGSGVGVGGSS